MIISLAYIIACVLFILGIKNLNKPATARRGNMLSVLGMAIAVVAVFFEEDVVRSWNTTDWFQNAYLWIFLAIAIGSIIGVIWSKKVKMTGMPELVAIYNGFGGLASFLVAVTQFLRETEGSELHTAISICLTIFTGAITFSGSMLAWGKLSEKISGRAVVFKGQKLLNLALLLGVIAASVIYVVPGIDPGLNVKAVIAITAVSFIFGLLVVLPIGGGDMPVVISLLNSLSGVAVAMAGFIISNTVLIVTGALVGASGIILTLIMCKAMNRSIGNLLFSGFGSVDSASKKGPGAEPGGFRRGRIHGARGGPVGGVYTWLWHGRRPGPACCQGTGGKAGGERGRGKFCDPPGRRAYARPHERASCGGRHRLRAVEDHG